MNHPDRVREHEAPHLRHTDVQTLDALLRIEELLVNLNELLGPRSVTDRGNYEDRVTPETTQPTKRKNPRQL